MTRPSGGFFVWWETPRGVDFDAKWFNENVAIPNQTLFVPSVAFYPPRGWYVNSSHRLVPFEPRKNGMRLSFSAVPEGRIYEGIERLGKLLKKHLLK
jgi:2-aminoadipate transaminase